ncbi:flagellar basal body L-ring protein FlgH [Congregibacter litoralis]|uniref:Flagellar L-ring protein n=1 Tax=Congregibacter litoralis KT71 TaxID=314285 RepID=A4A612_9GAMM|nr:flagellar basal body L-ring protein FlgH [Congregibacter litoralis]EAQ98459.1 Flagellar basal body L-ring protein [Congregibacter litoralis KT71]
MDKLRILLCVPLASLVACAGVESDSPPEYVKIEPIEYPEVVVSTAPTTGSLYADNRSMFLFEDVRAHEIGDIVSVVLVESTSATKSADTDVSKDNSVSIVDPTIFGAPVTINNGRYNLGTELSSSSAFESEGSSNQSNRLNGSIAVQVSRVLPNGNLEIQGEKWIKINQGDEYIRLRGIVRPEDLSPTNTIPSTLVADARISYGGTGILNESNTPGWLTRFFMSPLMPF